MMKNNKKIILIVLVSLSLFGLFFFSSHVISKPITELNYTDTIPGSLTVYDFMSKLRSEGKIDFTEKNYIGMGELIVSINGIKNNGDKNWIYYVNSKKANVGVSNYKINKGDIVSWKYEKSY
ncbi:MAG: DUF4430 domain-containing protein [Patescibacteria group bacterium]